MNALNNIRISPKLIGGYVLIAALIVAVSVLSYFSMSTMDSNMQSMYAGRLLPIRQLGEMNKDLFVIRGDFHRYGLIETERAALRKSIDAEYKLVEDNYALYNEAYMSDEERKIADKWPAAWEEYKAASQEVLGFFDAGNTQAAVTSVTKGGRMITAKVAADEILGQMIEINRKAAEDSLTTSNQNFSTSTTTLIISAIIGTLLAIVLGVIIANSITKPLQDGVTMMEEMNKGRLGTRLKFERKDEVGVLARAMDAFAEDLQKVLVASLKRIADGDLSADVPIKDASDEISPALKQTTEALRGLVSEANMLTKAAVEGRLSTRGDANKFQGGYRDIVKGVNDTLDSVINPLNVAANYVERIARGDVPAKITDSYNGDFNVIKNNLNTAIDAVNLLVADANMLSKAGVEGRLATRADASKHLGDFRRIVQGVNDTLDAVIGPLNVAANYVDRIAKGDIPAKITDTYNGDFNTIKNNLNLAIDAVNLLVADANMLSKAGVEGRLATRADASKHQGDFRKIVQGVNDTLDAVIGPLNVAANYVDRIAKGDIPAKITDTYNGDFNTIKNNLNMAIDAVNLLVADANMLSKAGIEGRLATRADASRHQGDFSKIVQGVNETLDAVIGPLNVASAYVESIAKGDIPGKITDNYNGDFNVLKNNLNLLSESLRDMITKVGEATNNVNSAAAEILAATTQQASGASEQAAAVTQTTTTVDEVKAISEQVVERAREVTESSKRTVEVSAAGQKAVQETIDSMYQIKEKVEGIAENILALSEKTQQIGEIISTVNDIASQSNMLALNASIEAARAGEHGKGFAVVAMEVRNLAEQSKAATAQVGAILSEIQNATNTTVMVTEEGTKGVDRGVRLAAQSQEAIEKLADTIRDSTQAAMQVMAGGQQQATGIEQIALAMKNINQVTVQGMASTKQAEKSAQNLNDLSRTLADVLKAYRAN